jgi:hypothetical protein
VNEWSKLYGLDRQSRHQVLPCVSSTFWW